MLTGHLSFCLQKRATIHICVENSPNKYRNKLFPLLFEGKRQQLIAYNSLEGLTSERTHGDSSVCSPKATYLAYNLV